MTDPAGSAGVDLRRALARHAGLTLLMVLLVVSGALLWTSTLTRDDALQDAITLGDTFARDVVDPLVTPRLLAGEAGAREPLDRLLGPQLADGTVRLALLRRADGTILYATDSRLLGRAGAGRREDGFRMPARTTAGFVSPGTGPAGALSGDEGDLIDVRAPLRGPSGEPLAYQEFLRTSLVPSASSEVTGEVLPFAITLLVVSQLLQWPLAISLARHVRAGEVTRRRLVERGSAALEAERRRLARLLHDDVIQDLAGAAYGLSSVAEQSADHLPAPAGVLLDKARTAVRRDLATLRGLLIDLYPARLAEVGLHRALEELLTPLTARGLSTELQVEVPQPLTEDLAALAYGTVREALRNVEQHARASSVRVAVSTVPDLVVLEVRDDGVGFDVAASRRESDRAAGDGLTLVEPHFGLRLLQDSVVDAGGTVELLSRPGGGTTIRVALPC